MKFGGHREETPRLGHSGSVPGGVGGRGLCRTIEKKILKKKKRETGRQTDRERQRETETERKTAKESETEKETEGISHKVRTGIKKSRQTNMRKQ